MSQRSATANDSKVEETDGVQKRKWLQQHQQQLRPFGCLVRSPAKAFLRTNYGIPVTQLPQTVKFRHRPNGLDILAM